MFDLTISLRRVALGVLWGIVGMALLAIALPARAGETTVSWEAPTTNCNGTLLTNPITGYSAMYGKVEELLPATARSWTVPNLSPGKWWFSIAVVTTVDRSEFATISKEVLPADFKTVAPEVYTVVKQANRFLFVAVGTIPAGVVCDYTQPMGTYYVVPRDQVTWYGLTRPQAVVARCG